MDRQPRAVSLISGGLDSMLATKAVLEQGVHVEGINFFTGFCVEGHTHAIRKQERDKPKRNNSLWVAEQLGIKLHIIDIVEDYKEVVLNPKHGYGANLNPCLDCKIFMVKKAKEWLIQHDFDFIITGEVIGQRPMSQRAFTMPIVAAESGADDLLLRPLSAQNLPASRAEREGWVKREQLFGFSGRSRKPQIALANQWGIQEYAQPAGGCCFLTDANYSDKLRDLWAHRPSRQYELDDIMLLKIGRHLRPRPHFKMILSREEGETNFLEGYKNEFMWIKTASCSGPLVLLDGDNLTEDDIRLAAELAARYSKGKDAAEVVCKVARPREDYTELRVKPFSEPIPAAWLL
ncbi:tRNA U34 2-thiouridine synthase MnmA/TrmU, contains the PP-loop ATPase domain [Thiothrix eikelboomii]|uniref:tRNA U34 2-thiouridine synthase MnmA/TrmU, contains the PP-loop ATPase domain n=1 Tax=Thiothrix eikelboomii TaxID=92487 RepID=A0A1T4XFI4_9GAMM|nr:tRNA (5-methylaminomethyl-2-thiouridylate)-methyltransferase [Thiothrix eikelboomii]SKA87831.1 tRNA U34 2-thiouridine synthase MnmA/TrmU, contains the PP-loop ATPase domain [Thiothrix eikelboomii]